MNKQQRKLFEKNIDLAETLAANATCVEADYDELLREAERMLADAVMKYDGKKHGSFEKFATPIIKRALGRIVNSNGNGLFTVAGKREKTEQHLYFARGEEVLKAELKIIHKSFRH